MLESILKNCEIDVVLGAVAAGTGDTQSSDIIDMSGWEGVIFICKFGDNANTAVATLTVQQNTENSTSGMATLSTEAVTYTCGASDSDDKALALEIKNPRERYLRAQLTRATANIAISGIIAIKYGAKELPITQNADILDSAFALNPAEV